MSPFLRREWIEAGQEPTICADINSLPSCEGSGLKHQCTGQPAQPFMSPFLRREWIEAHGYSCLKKFGYGLPSCEGSGLKHISDKTYTVTIGVSLLTKGVD